jgi:acetolactate decarboxylase
MRQESGTFSPKSSIRASAGIILAALLLLLAISAGCAGNIERSEYADNPVAGRETLVQVSTIDALMMGSYDGVMSLGTLGKYGDFGIGTFASLDGEMIETDGVFYQVKADGKAYQMSGSVKTPFACVTFFDTDREERLPQGLDYPQLEQYLDEKLPTVNIFYAIKIEGTFSYVKTRSVPPQVKPYPPLAEVTRNQPVFEFHNVEGTIIGFRCPPYVAGVNVPGYHLHFLTRNRDAGGHVLELTVRDATAFVDDTSAFMMLLPGQDSDFYKLDLTRSQQDEVGKVEK